MRDQGVGNLDAEGSSKDRLLVHPAKVDSLKPRKYIHIGRRARGVRATSTASMLGLMIDSGLVGSTDSLGGVPREQKMLKGHLPRVMYHQVY